jgi:hypothetical protein
MATARPRPLEQSGFSSFFFPAALSCLLLRRVSSNSVLVEARPSGWAMTACLVLSPPPHEALHPSGAHTMLDWIQNNFFLYVGILVLILIALVAVLFVVRKNQES